MTTPPNFYVGYLPAPPRHRRFLLALTPLLLLVFVGAGVIIAGGQRAPGDGVWAATPEVWSGTILTSPYPLLATDEGLVHLLVESGKHGPRSSLRTMAGLRATVRGWPIRRAGITLIELEPGGSGVGGEAAGEALQHPSLPMIAATGQEMTLDGEILDSKCYLGAMKPGDGKAHKACATLCIRGGIPPMLVSRGEDGELVCYLLSSVDGTAAPETLLEFVGEPVRVRGRPARLGSMPVLLIEPDAIERRGS